MLAFCTGMAIFFYRVFFPRTLLVRPQVDNFAEIPIPLLSDIPIVGPIFFNQDILVYLLYFLVVISTIGLFYTRAGLRVSAVGEYPSAADTVGVNVDRVRYASVLVGSALAGLGGAYLSLAVLGLYTDEMVAGRGFIALALVIFGRWRPAWVFAGGLLFGVIEALQSRLQFLGVPVPSEFLVMLPYVLTIVMVLLGRRHARPSAITIPYSRE
jgi:simple sugar transport system permease protein